MDGWWVLLAVDKPPFSRSKTRLGVADELLASGIKALVTSQDRIVARARRIRCLRSRIVVHVQACACFLWCRCDEGLGCGDECCGCEAHGVLLVMLDAAMQIASEARRRLRRNCLLALALQSGFAVD